ncbi:DUF4326 domain-containing protein [Spirosoma sp. 209]|uniref:DUF4326 domain-containing protein n=1 Tax=Spirosoma sp. 209 TaxID=1955701 RepID=UPI00098D1221|nr:DUF4326 domain-containing protein [Spirosoma sp. 209]
MITVVNRHKHKPSADDVYIGRPSLLGNPAKMDGEADRERVIELYRLYINAAIARRDVNICAELNRLYAKAKQGNLNLVCYCKPKACHGDVIKEILESKLNR